MVNLSHSLRLRIVRYISVFIDIYILYYTSLFFPICTIITAMSCIPFFNWLLQLNVREKLNENYIIYTLDFIYFGTVNRGEFVMKCLVYIERLMVKKKEKCNFQLKYCTFAHFFFPSPIIPISTRYNIYTEIIRREKFFFIKHQKLQTKSPILLSTLLQENPHAMFLFFWKKNALQKRVNRDILLSLVFSNLQGIFAYHPYKKKHSYIFYCWN